MGYSHWRCYEGYFIGALLILTLTEHLGRAFLSESFISPLVTRNETNASLISISELLSANFKMLAFVRV